MVTHLTKGTDSLHFYYDAANRPSFVEYNGTMYAYVHNLQGDIVGILDSTGTLVVTYSYDAWGKPIQTGGALANTLGKLNPFRYRGYVFDEETELYYLRSRYYCPLWCRFISDDTNIGSSSGYNYCSNSPVIKCDENGHIPFLLLLMRDLTKIHNDVADRVAKKVYGVTVRKETRIPNAGRHGGPGYPDVVVKSLTTKQVWEIKPYTAYGQRTGRKLYKRNGICCRASC